MHRRLPAVLIALLILTAAIASGCGGGSSDPKTEALPSQATSLPDQSSGTKPSDSGDDSGSKSSDSSGSSSGTVSADAKARAETTRKNCLKVAKQIPSGDQAKQAKKICENAYDSMIEAAKRGQSQMSAAAEQCKEASKQIPDEETRQKALAACAKLQ